MFQYFTNQGRCYVIIATNVLRQAFFKIKHNEIQYWHRRLIDGYLPNACKKIKLYSKKHRHTQSAQLNHEALLSLKIQLKIYRQ